MINESEYTVKPLNSRMTLTGPPKPTHVTNLKGTEGAVENAATSTAQGPDKSIDSANGATDTSRSAAVASVIGAMVKATTLAGVVRFCGAGMIALAVSLFLMQGVEASNDLQRFHRLLAQTGLLGAAGFAIGFLLKEPRGARVFLSLGLVSIPANLAVLGGMIYSVVHAGELTARYPDYANWQASNLTEIAIALATGALVLVPMALFAFSVFARQSRTWLTSSYLLVSAVLLLPVRSTFVVTLIAGSLIVGLTLLVRRQRASRASVMTGEERFSQLILFLPPVLMIVRSALLYSNEFSMLVTLSGIVYLVLRTSCLQWQTPSWLANSIHLLSALSAVCLAGLLSSLLAVNMIFTAANLSFCLILGGLLLELSRRVPSPSIRWWMHTGWALLCVPSLLGNSIFSASATSIILALAICVLIVVSGIVAGRRSVTAIGVLTLLGNVLLQGSYMTSLLMNSSWISLTLMGAAIIASGSLIELYGVPLRLQLQTWQNKTGMSGAITSSHGSTATGRELNNDADQDLAA